MARKLKEIRENLSNLEEKVTGFHENLLDFYGEYIEILTMVVKRQLVLAAYQVSTQKYPEQFLKLSFSDREKFQKKIRDIANNFQRESFDFQRRPTINPELAQKLLKAMLNQLKNEQETPEEFTEDDLESTENDLEFAEDDLEFTENDLLASEQNSNEETNQTEAITFTNPEELSLWQQNLEKQIRDLLDKISSEANQTLQSFDILPSKLPSKLLEMAIKAEEKGAPMTGPPNLLNVLIEAKNNDKPEDATITPVTAIHLRLSELEFSDFLLTNQREKIRNLLAELATIKRKYKKVTKELAIAEAETAWRSSWHEDS